MSILMHLKYPLSFPPTEEQLRALPAEIYEKWVDDNHPNIAFFWRDHPQAVAGHFRAFPGQPGIRADFETLKQAIFNIDE